MTVLAKGAVEKAAREVFPIISRWAYTTGDTPRPTTEQVAQRVSRAAILAFLRHLKDKGLSEAQKAEFAAGAQKMHGVETEDWKACAWDYMAGWNMALSRLIEEMEGE
jgi:hypothetical protein